MTPEPTAKLPASAFRIQDLRLDWEAYFRLFSAEHGGDPLVHDGRLLYRDGWMYGLAGDYRGPEYPPPASPAAHRALQRVWWEARRAAFEQLRRDLAAYRKDVRTDALHRPLPLQVKRTIRDPDTGRPEVLRFPLDVPALEEELRHLTEDVAACDENLKLLEEPKPNKEKTNV